MRTGPWASCLDQFTAPASAILVSKGFFLPLGTLRFACAWQLASTRRRRRCNGMSAEPGQYPRSPPSFISILFPCTSTCTYIQPCRRERDSRAGEVSTALIVPPQKSQPDGILASTSAAHTLPLSRLQHVFGIKFFGNGRRRFWSQFQRSGGFASCRPLGVQQVPGQPLRPLPEYAAAYAVQCNANSPLPRLTVATDIPPPPPTFFNVCYMASKTRPPP